MESIQQVIDRFDFQGKTADCRAFGNGHINTTYIITTDLPEGGQAAVRAAESQSQCIS